MALTKDAAGVVVNAPLRRKARIARIRLLRPTRVAVWDRETQTERMEVVAPGVEVDVMAKRLPVLIGPKKAELIEKPTTQEERQSSGKGKGKGKGKSEGTESK